MPKLQLTVAVNLYGLRKFKDALADADLRTSESRPIRNAVEQWGVLITDFLTTRWVIFSLGGGNWRALNAKYLAWKTRKGLLPFILRATDQAISLFSAKFARKPGAMGSDVKFGVRVSFGEAMQVPHMTNPQMTVASVMMLHQQGVGRLPQRKVIVGPDTETRGKMRAVMDAALREVASGK